MNKPFLSFLYSFIATLALVSTVVAESSATFTLYTPRYYKDSLLISANPSFVLGQRGQFTSFESSPIATSTSFAVDASALSQAHPGYYVSKWVLSKAWGAGMGGTAIQTQSGGTGFTVSFDYKWASKYGTQLDLTVHLSQMSYSVSYDANGGAWKGGEPETGPWTYSAGGAVPGAQDVSRVGYALTGWARNTGKAIEPGASFTGATLGVTSDGQEVRLTAQWSAQPYVATVAAGEGGSGGCAVDYSYSENQSQSKTIMLPTREGYAISSWTATGYSGSAPTVKNNVLTIPAKTAGDFTMTPVWQAATYALRLEMTPGIAKICYRLGSQTYYDETTVSVSVPAAYGTAWAAYALAIDGCTTNETCAASGTIGTGGAQFRPRVDTKPYPLRLRPGAGIAEIFYKTNEAQKTWIRITSAAVVPVLFGDTWSAYAVAAAGYTYTATSEALPKTGVMTTAGGEFAPSAVANVMTVRYEPNGSTESRLMNDETFTYGIPKALALNKYSKQYHVYYYSDGSLVDEGDAIWTFTGWNSRADGHGDYTYADGEEVTNPCGSTGAGAGEPAATVLLFAQWSGGTVTLPLPKKAGYDFSGWYTARTGGQRIGGDGTTFAPSAATKLYAHWRAHVTQLAFVVDGQEKAEFAHTVANGGKYSDFGSLPELTSDDPKKIFLGWYTEPEGGTLVTDATTVNLAGDSATLYAQWENAAYAITYETNGGTINEYAKPGYRPGQAFALPTDVTRAGRSFLGWYDNPTFEGDPIAGITSGMTGDKTFYARWSAVAGETVTLTFVNVSGYTSNKFTSSWSPIVNAATPALVQSYAKNAKATLPGALFAQEGLTQEGWRQASDTKANPDTWDKFELGYDLGVVTQDLAFHTIWRTNTYTVVYNGNGHEFRDGSTIVTRSDRLYGAPETTLSKGAFKEEEQNLFIGWAYTTDGHAVYGGTNVVYNLTAVDKGVVTLYAVWEEKKVAEAPPVPPAPKLTAVRMPLTTLNFQPTTLNSQPYSYTLHFSPGAAVVNPTAMTNWENCVSGSAVTPDCLYTNLYSDGGFKGWIYNGETNKTVAPVAAFDGQIITVEAAWADDWKPGTYSDAVGLTNATLKCKPATEWEKQKTGGVDKSKPACLKADPYSQACTLSMQVSGPGRITYYWHYNLDSDPGPEERKASTIVDGVMAAIESSTEWEKKEFEITGDGLHQVSWYLPQQSSLANFWIDKVRWEPVPRQYEITSTAVPGKGCTTGGDGTYAVGEAATLWATTASGYEFVQWNDGSTDPVHTTTVWGDITDYVATFKVKEFTITGQAEPSAGGSVKGAGSYAVWTEVTLTAVPNAGYAFVRWSDGVTTPARQVTVTKDETYTAVFTKQYAITATAVPGGSGMVTGGGTYLAGATVTLRATGNDDWAFVRWRDGETNPERSFTAEENAAYVALFTNRYVVTVSASPTSGGAVTGGGRFVVGTGVNLTATANTGWSFERWSDGATEATRTITVLCETNLTATFLANNYPLTLTVGEGVAKVWYEIGSAEAQSTTVSLTTNIAYGTSYKLWAEAKAGYEPQGSGWSREDAIKGQMGTAGYEFKPDPDKQTYAVVVVADPTEGGTVTGAGTYEYAAGAELVAAANTGWSFGGWSDGSPELTNTIMVVCATNLTATFRRNEYPLALTVSEGVAKIWYAVGSAAAKATTSTLTTNIAYGTSYRLWAEAKYGYALTGAGSSEAMPVEGTMGAEGVTFAPAPARRNYAMTAEPVPAQGGTVTGSGTYEYEAEATVTAEPNAGYTFARWSDGATEATHVVTVLCETNLTAVFSVFNPKYYIVYDGNGATAGAMGEQTNSCGEAAILSSNAFVRTGYVFGGWESVAGMTVGKPYADGATVTDDLALTNRAALLKAIWKPAEYRVDFDPGAGRGTMDSLRGCQYGVNYQLPACAFVCDKLAFSNWVDEAGTTYADGAIVRDLSATGGVVTLYAVWGGHGQAFVNITGHTATKYYTGRPFTVSGYDVDIPSEGYYEKDFTTKPGVTTSLTETDVGTYSMGLTEDSFTNLVPSVSVQFDVKGDGWLKILPSQIGGEPGGRTVPSGGLSKFDKIVEYGTAFDVSAISNDFANAYGPCGITYSALESGPWSEATPTFASIGTTSFWYRVTAANLKLFLHEVAVEVVPRDMANVTVAAIPDQTWTGQAITPKVTVTDGNPPVITPADYTVKYSNNVDPGTATVTLTGKGNYTGTKTVNFKIQARPSVRVMITGHTATATYDGRAHTASGYDFVSTSSDYTAADFWCKAITSVSRTAIGTTSANLTAADFENLNSGFDVTFVVARDISVTVTQGSIPGEPGSGTVPAGGLSKYDATAAYDGKPHTLDLVALTNAFAGAGYAIAGIEYAADQFGPWAKTPIAITDVGAVSFWYRVSCDNCAPFAHQAKVTVTPRDIAHATVVPIPDQVVTGEPIEPEVTVTDGRPSIITAGDYDVEYSDNVAVGTATVTLTGKGNYAGTLAQTFEIVPLPGYYVVGYGEQVSVNLQADFPDRTIKSVSGLPSGLKYKNGYVTGKSTKAVTEKVATITFMDRTKEKTYWTVKPGENHGVEIDFGASAAGETSAETAVGTAVEWSVTTEEEGAKVTISNLPTGLKYNKTTGLITGTPTKAKEYKMTVKTVVNGLTVTQVFDITVEGLPAMMVGTYYGAAEVDGIAGQFQLKLTAAGKATGYFYAVGKKVSLKSTALGEAGGCYVVTVSYTYNKVKCTDEIVLQDAATVEGAKGDDVDIWSAALGAESDVLDAIDARRDVIKEVFGKVVPKTTTYDVLEKTDEGEYLKAKVTTAGKVTVSGKLLSEAGKLTSVSCSTNLIVDDEGNPYCWITIYKTVSKSEPIVYDEVWYLPDED